jgi:hypothetical protein
MNQAQLDQIGSHLIQITRFADHIDYVSHDAEGVVCWLLDSATFQADEGEVYLKASVDWTESFPQFSLTVHDADDLLTEVLMLFPLSSVEVPVSLDEVMATQPYR